MTTTTQKSMLSRLFEPIAECLTPEVARKIAAVRLDAEGQRQLDDWAERNTEGTITTEERDEYLNFVKACSFISLLQAHARKVV